MAKRTLFTDEEGLEDFENGNVFYANHIFTEKYKYEFTVESSEVVEENVSLVVIDTGSNAEFI